MNGMRKAVALLAVMAASASTQDSHAADPDPSRPIRFNQCFSHGGISDTWARIVGENLEKRLGQPIVVGTRPGGGGIVGNDSGHRGGRARS